MRREPIRKCAQGFTYPLVLLIVALFVIGAKITNEVTSTLIKREREAELIQRGQYFYNAIKSYYHAGADGRYPRSLDELVRDPRFPYKSHIRKIYPEPFFRLEAEAGDQWNIITNEQGDIIGVASKSEVAPLKKGGFPNFATIIGDGERYADWHFVYVPENTGGFPAENEDSLMPEGREY